MTDVRAPGVEIVVPTIARPSLRRLLVALAGQTSPPPPIIVVDDRPGHPPAPCPDVPDGVAVTLVRSGGGGPAAARNTGWRAATARWVAFLDDDVVPRADWCARLAEDLAALGPDVGGSQGRIHVPLPADRKPTDWERNVAGLARARWATADMAYRRDVLAAVGGFDERFPRAYREDADLGLRVTAAGWRIEPGRRVIDHPPGPAGRWVSVRLQSGNADDVLIRAVHGPDWREKAAAPAGRIRRHAATTAAGFLALATLPLAPRHHRVTALTAAAAAAWLTGTAELAWTRLAPGPKTADEVVTVVASSLAIPPAATWHRLAGLARLPRLLAAGGPEAEPVRSSVPARPVPAAVLLDRDGTLVRDVPYNGNPRRVEPMPGARRALDRLREAGVPLAVVSNQSGIGRGRLSLAEVEAVNRRVEELLGPIGPWLICPHTPDDGCACRKPAPGLILEAAAALGVEVSRCAFVGDIGADVDAARAAGARAVLVPTPITRPEEIEAAPEVAPDLEAAVDLLLGAPR